MVGTLLSGAFLWVPPCNRPVRLGVGVVGLLPLQNAGEPAASQIVDQLRPARTRGFFCAARCATDCGIVSVWAAFPPPFSAAHMADLAPLPLRGFFCGRALCKDGAGLSANLLEVARNLSDGRCWPGKPTLPLRRRPRANSGVGRW